MPGIKTAGIKNKGKRNTITGKPASLAWSQSFYSCHPNGILNGQDQNIQMREMGKA